MFASPYYWWVQSVMPVVFDNSLSYYEVLAKLTQYVEGLIGDVDKIEKLIGTIEGIEDVTEFMDFLRGVQNEIGNLNNLPTQNKSDLVSAINEIVRDKIGNLSNLNAQNKSDLVSAINEVVQNTNNDIGNLNNLPTRDKSSLVGALSEVYARAQNGYILPFGGIPESDLSTEVQNKLNSGGGGGGGTVNVDYKINNVTLKKSPNNNTLAELGIGTYSVPAGGIPESTLSEEVRAKLNSGGGGGGGGTYDYTALINKPQINGHTLNGGDNSASVLGLGTYSKPSGGIPESDLSNGVAAKLNGAYVMPVNGIPESDLSDAVKEKLNTSGGIADENNGFVARRNYEAGELVYINGVLYRVTNRTLAGSNFVVGNNIVETDINNELADINDKIDRMASGQGLDSWSLVAELTPQGSSPSQAVTFFDYIRCTGGEDYLFIATRINDYSNQYSINIYKRDGTLVGGFQNPEYNMPQTPQARYTFTPEETGDYYCTITGAHYTVERPYIKVELEYTQSQGITELWNQVNQAATIEPRVAAVEGLVEQQQSELEGLDGIPERVNALEDDVEYLKDTIDALIETDIGEWIDYSYGDIGVGYINGYINSSTKVVVSSSSYATVYFQVPSDSAFYASITTSFKIVAISNTEPIIGSAIDDTAYEQNNTPTANNPWYANRGQWVIATSKSTNNKPVLHIAEMVPTVVHAEDATARELIEKLRLAGKKWTCLGDSWTAINSYASKHYYNYISEKLGCTFLVKGIGGTGYYANDGVSGQEFYNRVSNLGTPDFVTIFGGGNDANVSGFADILGDVTDTDTSTICGAINETINNYMENYPSTPIGIISPAPWIDNGFRTTNTGNRLEQFCDKLEQIAKIQGIPYLDLYHTSGLRPENESDRTIKYYTDGKHPNNLGQEVISTKICQFILTFAL